MWYTGQRMPYISVGMISNGMKPMTVSSLSLAALRIYIKTSIPTVTCALVKTMATSMNTSLAKKNDENIMAYILSDQNEIPLRVSVFTGTDKASPLFSVKEFGNTCILYSMEKILEYGDAINIMQADERNRQSDRKEVPLFDLDVFREAIVNAFVHNKWLILNSPSITIFTDRMEILSHGGLAIDQDEIGFFNGSSIPINESLASIFLQLRISERSGRGVPKIVSKYGKQAIKIEKNTITVTIPFNKINVNKFNVVSDKVYNKVDFKLNKSQDAILKLIRDNPNITADQMAIQIGISVPAIKKNLKQLTDNNIIKRVGAKKEWILGNNSTRNFIKKEDDFLVFILLKLDCIIFQMV